MHFLSECIIVLSCCILSECELANTLTLINPETAVCEGDTDALTDPKGVLYSMETTDCVPQSEKTFSYSKGASDTHTEADGR